MSKLQRVVINSGSNIFNNLLLNLVSLITLPYYILVYGEEKWGVYLLSMTLYSTFVFLDMGLKVSLRRFVSKYTADGDVEKMEVALSLSTVIVLSIAVLNASLLCGLSPFLGQFFNVSEKYLAESTTIFLFSGCFAFFFWAIRITNAILEGYQLFLIKNINQIVATVGMVLIYIYVHFYELKFTYLVLALFGVRIIPFFLDLIVIVHKRLLKGVRLRWKLKKSDFKSEIFSFSQQVFILSLIAVFTQKTDALVLGSIIGATMVTYYAIITKPISIVKMISSFLFSAIEPMIAKEHTKNNTSFLKNVVLRGTRVHILTITPLIILVMLFLESFLHVWIGTKYDAYIIWGIIAGLRFFFIPYFSSISKVMINTGKTAELIRIDRGVVIVNFIVSVILTYWIGLGGVVIGTILDVLLKIPFYLNISKREFKVGLSDIIIKEIVLCYIYWGLCSLVIYSVLSYSFIDSWLLLILSGFIGALLIALLPAYYLFFGDKILGRQVFKQNKISSL